MKKIIIIGARPRSLINFRGELIKTFILKGLKVTALASKKDPHITAELNKRGASFNTFSIKRNGFNPYEDLKTLLDLKRIFINLQPDIILAYTIKPVIWGGIASSTLSNVKFYALITGLGFAFQGKSFKRRLLNILVTYMYKFALKNAVKVIFQNKDNMQTFISLKIIPADKCEVVNGSGIDINYYQFSPIPSQKMVFLSIGRLLGEKGFREYARAAQIVKEKYPNVIFQLLGHEDPSPDGIPIEEVKNWHDQGWLEYLGSTSDVRPYLKNCHIFVLPSYHEGMPRSVLEAISIGRPILTTDVPGCRNTVKSGHNGYLVPKADAKALAERMIWFIENRTQWKRMGKNSRQLAEEEFDVTKVNKKILKIMNL